STTRLSKLTRYQSSAVTPASSHGYSPVKSHPNVNVPSAAMATMCSRPMEANVPISTREHNHVCARVGAVYDRATDAHSSARREAGGGGDRGFRGRAGDVGGADGAAPRLFGRRGRRRVVVPDRLARAPHAAWLRGAHHARGFRRDRRGRG